MLIFEYNCLQLPPQFRDHRSFIREKVSCPKCESSAVEKQLSVFSSPGSQSEKTVSAGGCGCTPNLRLPLVRIWRPQIPGKIGADPFKRLTDIRENSLFHQLSTHPKVQ